MLVCSIDNMPTQLPMESTDLFGNLVLPYAMNILQSDATKPLEEHTFSPTVLGVSQPCLCVGGMYLLRCIGVNDYSSVGYYCQQRPANRTV